MTPLLALLSVAGYLTSLLLLWKYLNGRAPSTTTLDIVWLCTLLVHAAVLLRQLSIGGGINLSVILAFSAAFWLVNVILLYSTLKRPLHNLALWVFPLTATTLAISVLRPELTRLPVRESPAMDLHILVSMLANALFIIAALLAVSLSLQHRRLHQRKTLGLLARMPALQDSEHLLFRLIIVGLVLLSYALVSGFLLSDGFFAHDQLHKSVLSILAWLVFVVLLVGRQLRGWRGPTAIRLTLIGFGLLALAYFGSKIVREIILRQGL